MLRQLLIILACLCEEKSKSHEVPQIVTRLPDFIHEFCPDVHVCTNKTFLPPLPGYAPCCIECSCDSDCVKSNDCCFPHTIQTNPVVKTSDRDFRNDSSCFYPIFPQPTEMNEKLLYQSFTMISSAGQGSSSENLNHSCGETKVAPWGSLYPVSSVKSKKIYKNIKCAHANGITDVLPWQAIMNCYPDEVINVIIGLESQHLSENCEISFFYYGDADDLKASECYLSLIETCPSSPKFDVPKGTSVSKDDIVALCQSGFYSPYLLTGMYANVFCHICNENFFMSARFCRTVSTGLKGITSKGFIALIDGSLIDDFSGNNIANVEDSPLACSYNEGHFCRHVLCPSGQLRDKTGNCVHPSKLWLNQNLGVHINLTIEKQINLSDVFEMSSGEISYVLPQLKSPWGKFWSISKIFYKETDIQQMSNNFIIAVAGKLQRIQPSTILKYIEKMVTQPWSFVINDETVVLKSSQFATYKISPKMFDVENTKMFVSEKIKMTPVKARYKPIYRSMLDYDHKQHTITQMYFCEQVELNESEFILSQDNSMLYYKTYQRFLFDWEFHIIKINSLGRNRVRICIEETGLQRSDSGKISHEFVLSLEIIHIFIFLIYSLCCYNEHIH